MKRLEEWRRLIAKEAVTSLEDRKLVLKPLLRDRKLLLSVREMTTTKQIEKLMRELLPYHAANFEAIDCFQDAYLSWLDGDDQAFEVVFDKLENPFVTSVVLENTVSNIRLLVAPHRDWIAEDAAYKEEELK